MKLFTTTYSKTGLLTLAAVGVLAAQPPGRTGGRPFGFGGGPNLDGALLHGTITGAPFSASETIQSQRTLTNGTQMSHQQQSSIYRDAQGRVRIDSTLTPPASSSGATSTPVTVSTIYDPVAGYIYRLNAQNKTAVQSPIRQPKTTATGTAPTRTSPTGVTVQTTSLGTQTINGVTATGTQVTTTIAAGTFGNSAAIQTVRTTWISSALQIPVQVTVTDPRSGNMAMNLTNILQTAPDPSLFQVPAGYTVTTHSSQSHARPFMRH
jgi:cytoskeletal protein RodZ